MPAAAGIRVMEAGSDVVNSRRGTPGQLPEVAAEGRDLLERRWTGVDVHGSGRAGSDDSTDVQGGMSHVLMLPDPEHSPAEGDQMSVGLTISLDVAGEFGCPPHGVVCW